MFKTKLYVTTALLLGSVVATNAHADICVGNCGKLGANGVVTASPNGSPTYDWISTDLGQQGAGVLAGFGGTDGSRFTSSPFFAKAGSEIKFDFNYVTSDGGNFPDYAWAQLVNTQTGKVVTLLTARTKPSGSIIPGQDLPAPEATLTPSSVPIKLGSTWAPLGPDSGRCFNTGCGHTGWVNSSYKVDASGTYELRFGVTNVTDTQFDSGLAFSGLLVNNVIIGDGSSANNPLPPANEVKMPDGTTRFEFTIQPTPGKVIFIDPTYAQGYTYNITGVIDSKFNAVTKVVLPKLIGDDDGYQVFDLAGTLLANVLPGGEFTFTNPLQGFKVLGIDMAAMVDPNNPTGFVTGLDFVNDNKLNFSQQAIPFPTTDVPAPASLALVLLGLLGIARQRRNEKLTA